jgi:hypothetical protein
LFFVNGVNKSLGIFRRVIFCCSFSLTTHIQSIKSKSYQLHLLCIS